MPPLLCASPFILDQSFPRCEQDLLIIAHALGEIQNHIECDRIHLILTTDLQQIVEEFDWSRTGPYPLLGEIFKLLNLWFLQPHDRLVKIDVENIDNYHPHPLPQSCRKEGLTIFWSDEVGRILTLHDRYSRSKFFIGIGCESAFAGEKLGLLDNPNNQRAFPLIGPREIDLLQDAYEWSTPLDIHQKEVTFQDVHKNYKILGATHIQSPTSGSHYKVMFRGQRPWVLDPNNDPIPERFLRELIEITGYPINVIKTALVFGKLPDRVIRFKS